MEAQDAALELARQYLNEPRAPTHYDKVYKDECMFSFDTSESPGGLYINLQTHQAFGSDFVSLDHERSGVHLYLHEKAQRVPLSEDEQSELEKRPEKLAVGGDGGFQVNKKNYKTVVQHQLAILPSMLTISWPNNDLPWSILNAIEAVLKHDSAGRVEDVSTWEEERRVSKYAADLLQEPAWRVLPSDPKLWKCDFTGVTENLWLNLSTGYIGSGRAFFDGTGGNGAALQHYREKKEQGKECPLVVKLGTITPHGADVYSYATDEDDMVLDPHLDTHLAHWGINMMQMQKTEKSMAELQIDLNMAFEFDRITESGAALQPLRGAKHIGLRNLGNSCYMNSVLQVLWTLPELQRRYVDPASQFYKSAPVDVSADFPSQMAKVGVALVLGRTGAADVSQLQGSEVDEAELNAVKPQRFKSLVGRNHAEFSSPHQQDALEYFRHLLQVVARSDRANASRMPADAEPIENFFRFATLDRIQCGATGAVSYKRTTTTVLELDIPLDAATNSSDVQQYKQRELKRQKLKDAHADAYIAQQPDSENGTNVVCKDSREDPVIPNVPFAACVSKFVAAETMQDYYSAAAGARVTANKTVQLATFPPYLMVALRRYYVDERWVARKMEVAVEVPEELDLEGLRGTGPQAGEQLQPEDASTAAPSSAAAQPPQQAAAAVKADDELVAQLMSMGFSQNGCMRACIACQNAGAEACMEWIIAHMEDADFNDPLPEQQSGAASSHAASQGDTNMADAEQLSMLTVMGFTEQQAGAALKACGGNVERAADWLFSHADDLDAAVASVESTGNAAPSSDAAAGAEAGGGSMHDGAGKYKLIGFISHMGSNTACGHYVCHIKKDGRWIIFNDEKVALSEHPPKELGYMYLYQRCDWPSVI